MGRHTSSVGSVPTDDLLREGIAAAKAGDRGRAHELLMRVVEQDEGSVAAWLWLSGLVDSLEDREVCLENVLTLDPENEAAQTGLDWVREQRQGRRPDRLQTSTSSVEQAPAMGSTPNREPLWEEPPDALLCPYCARRTEPDDRRCPHCGGELWIKVRRREAHSLWLWNLMVVRFSVAVFSAVMPLVALTAVAYILAEQFDPMLLLPAYLGLGGSVDPALHRAALEMLPRIYLLPFLVLSLYSFVLLVGMYLRWKPIFFLLLGGVAVRFALAVTAAVLGQIYGILCGGFGVLVSIAWFFILMHVQDDFFWDTSRVFFQLDRKAQGGAARLERARALADRGMWALAALYTRAAVAKMPGMVAGYVRLAHAYLRLGRPDLSGEVLAQAKLVDPRDPRVQELVVLLQRVETERGLSV